MFQRLIELDMKQLSLSIHNDILLAIDDNIWVILVLLDLSAAFDTVGHDILLGSMNIISKFAFAVVLGSALKATKCKLVSNVK